MSGGSRVFGIGTDVREIARIRASLDRYGLRFANKILTPQEMQIFESRRARWPHRGVSFLATRFSAKEAFSKAIGLGLRMPMSWHTCEVVNAPSGAPVVRVLGELKPWFESQGLSAKVSISDEREYAVSFVVVEQTTTDITSL